ncbi:MAG: phage holin family protein [Anaerolineales bacterium]
MTKFILRWAINAIALFVAVRFVPGIHLQSGWASIIWLALIFGLINAFLRPLLKLLTCPLIVLTLGLFTLLINTFLFWLTAQIGQTFGIGFTLDGFWPAFLGALVVSLVSLVMSLILKDELKKRRR